MKNIPTVSEKDTKTVIIEKFNQLRGMYDEAAQAKVSPETKITAEKNKGIIESANKVATVGTADQVDKIVRDFATQIGKAAESVITKAGEYETLVQAIELKKKELEEICGIKDTAFALFALIDLQKEQEQNFDNEMAMKKAELQDLIENAKQEANKALQESREAVRVYERETKEKRDREEKDYTYERDRKRRLEDDAWTDEKNVREKELSEREKAVSEREQRVNELEEKVASIPSLIDAAVKSEVGKAKAIAESAMKHEREIIAKETELKESLNTEKFNNATAALEAEKLKNAELTKKLDEAYTKIETISTTAVEAASGARYMDRVESLTRQNTGSSK